MTERERVRLSRLVAEGDADALQRLIVSYHPQLRRAVEYEHGAVMRRYIDPDDVLQLAYASAFKTFSSCRFDSPTSFYRWLELIALHQLKDVQRAMRSQKRDIGREVAGAVGPTSSYPDLAHRLAAADATPSRLAVRAEGIAELLSSLARLTDDQRAVVRLRFLEGRSVAETAARMGKTEAAIHALCHRGLKALRDLMVSVSRFHAAS